MTAQIVAVVLGSAQQHCLGVVTVVCPWCTQSHKHRVFDNDTTVFMRTAPCTTEKPVLRYRIDLTEGAEQCHQSSH